MSKNIVVAGDFHNDAAALDYLLTTYADQQIILLGDFFDSIGRHTGDPIAMMNLLGNLSQNSLFDLKLVIGNHDAAILDFIYATSDFSGKFAYQAWASMGGANTLRRLGAPTDSRHAAREFLEVNFADAINFLDSGVKLVNLPHLIAVHGGLDWALPDPLTTSRQDAMWIRDEYLFHHNDLNKTIVSGHTPVQEFQDVATIMKLQNEPDDHPRYLIDGGNNSGAQTGRVNIAIFNQNGDLIDTDFY